MPDIKPIIPQVVQPDGVVVSIDPRPMSVSSDQEREQAVQETGGEPRVDHAGRSNPYIDYQSTDLLHSLQHLRSEGYDEMCFYIMGSTKELLFRGLHMELVNARDQIMKGNTANAIEILDRARAYLDHIADTWNVLGTITSKGFNQFRDHLSTASGQLSYMYRHVEFILGNKSERLARAHRNVPHVWPAMKENFESPSLYDEVLRHLNRKGHAVAPTVLDRDWKQPYESNESVRNAWLSVYEQPSNENLDYQLAEMLVKVDESFSVYRWRHFVTVHKILGGKPGTGGSAGVGWLESITKHRFFPELWEIRDQL
jgi:tryptophan 2,3-dioxygenase